MRTVKFATLVASLAMTAVAASQQPDSKRVALDIAGQPISDALNEFAHQSGLQIVFYSNIGKGLTSQPLSGSFSPTQALNLLLANTSLSYKFINPVTVAIVPARTDPTKPSAAAFPYGAIDGLRLADSSGSEEPIDRPVRGFFSRGLHLSQAEEAKPSGTQQGDASAETPEDGKLAEIVVTAQRREEKLSDVPMSIQALTQADMDAQGLVSIDDLSRAAPAVTFQRVGTNAAISNFSDELSDISIRGVDSLAGAPTTGIYIDDTPIMERSNVQAYPALVDLDRVEVLKGPQGTLFGGGSEGGAIRFITPQPSLTTFSGFARAEAAQVEGGSQNYSVVAAFGGPLINDVLGFRISASYRQDGGWIDRVDYAPPPGIPATCAGCVPSVVYASNPRETNVVEPNANWHETSTFRAALRWQLTEGLIIDPSIYVQELHINDTSAYWMTLSEPQNNVYNNGDRLQDENADTWALGTVKVSWALPWADFISNSSYWWRENRAHTDYSQWLNALFLGDQYGKSASPYTGKASERFFTQEFRLSSSDSQSKFQWTGGVFLQHAAYSAPVFIYSASLAPLSPNNLFYAVPSSRTVDQQLAGFGDLTWKLATNWSATVGLRYADLKYSSSGLSQGFGALAAPPVVTNLASTNTALTPRAVLKFYPSADTMLYASAAKGYRAGFANAPSSSALTQQCGVATPLDVAPDNVWQYELGTKSRLLNSRLEVDAAVYYLRWSGIQQTVNLACGESFAANLGAAVGKGGEISVRWQAGQHLNLGLNAAYTDTYYESVASFKALGGNSITSVRPGDHLPAAPWNADMDAQYVWDVGQKHPYFRADYRFTSAQRSLTPYLDPANAPNADPTLPGLPETRLLNLRAGLRWGSYDVSLFANNVLDYHTPYTVNRDYATAAIDGVTPNFDTNYYGRPFTPPTTVGVTANVVW